MSRKRGTAVNKTSPRATVDDKYGVTFVNILLSDNDKAVLRTWQVDETELFAQLERWVEDGYKVSLSIDHHNTGGICSLTGKVGCTVDGNVNRCLVSRGPDMRGAMLATMYKLEAYCPSGEFPTTDVVGRNDFA